MKKRLLQKRFQFLIFLALVFVGFDSIGATLYSITSGQWATSGTWSSTGHGGASCACTPTSADDVIIGNGHVITVASTASALFAKTITVNDAGGGTLTFGNGGTATTLTVSGTITINSSGILQSGGTGATLHTLIVQGNVTNAGTLNLTANSATNQSLQFNASSLKSLSGAGTTTLQHINVNTTSSANVGIDQSITVNGTVTFSANGLLVINSSVNMTMGSSAAFSGVSSSRYVQLDGTSGTNGNLNITTAASTTGAWVNNIPVGTSTGGYTPVKLGTTLSAAPTAGSVMSVKVIFNQSNQGQLRRVFRLIVTGNAVTTYFTNGVFNYNGSTPTTDISSGDAEVNYSQLWFLKIPTGSWSNLGTDGDALTNQFTVPGNNSPSGAGALAAGTYYYTIGTTTAYPNTWYSYQSGVWSNYLNWTLDPSGTTFVNPLNLPPVPGDAIVILGSTTITNDVNTQTASSTIINAGGVLDMSTTTGNTIGTLTGTGTLRVKGATLPSGTYTSFVSSTGGTIEYYDVGGTVDATQTTTYNKLKFTNTTGAPQTFITTSNLIVNGTITITGTDATNFAKWQINNSSTTQLTLTLNGDVTVGSGGRIGVGTGAPAAGPHALSMLGNITNNGVIYLFDETDAGFSGTYLNSASSFYTTAHSNSVNLTYSNTGDNSIDCQGTTKLYRLILNKGTGTGALLTVNSSAVGNFQIYGPANDMSNPALYLLNGTLKLTGSMSLGYFTLTNSDYPIATTAGLWLNGSGVTVTVTDNSSKGGFNYNTALNGTLHLTAGTYNAGSAPGVIAGDQGTLIVDGSIATLNVWQIRGANPSSGTFTYSQSDGTVNVGYGLALDYANNSGSYCRFDLGSSTATFQMTGGTLNVAKPTAVGGFLLGSTTGYYTVTGGTVNFWTGPQKSNSDQTFIINTTAPLYNLNIERESFQASSTTAQLSTNSLTVLNNLTIAAVGTPATPTLDANSLDVTVGGNFDIQTGTTFTPGTNTVTLNGSGAQTWTHNGTIASLNNVVINKSAGTLTLAGSQTFPNIAGGLTITAGTVADGGKTLTVTGSVLYNSGTITGTATTRTGTITSATNSATVTGSSTLFNTELFVGQSIYTTGGVLIGVVSAIGSNTSLTLATNATVALSGQPYQVYIGSVVVSSSSTVATVDGSGGTFVNLTIGRNTTLTTNGDQTVSNDLFLSGGASCSLNIGSNALTVLGGIYTSAAGLTSFTTSRRIVTSGVHSEGGLTRTAISTTALLFPVGTVTANKTYTPATIAVTYTGTKGTITVRNVSNEHPNVITSGQSLTMYWRVTSSGYSGITSVIHNPYTFQNTANLAGANTTTYRTARWDASALSWAYLSSTYDATAGTSIPSFATNTGWTGISSYVIDGEYTCGFLSSFNGTFQTFYSTGLSSTWSSNTAWSSTAVGGASGSANPTSCSNCPVVIGDATHNHTINIDANNEGSGSVSVASGSTLDCGAFTGLDFGVITNISGFGKIRVGTGAYPTADFTQFTGSSGGTMEWYSSSSSSYTIPNTYSSFYNLIISPGASSDITLPNVTTLTVYHDFSITGSNSTTSRVPNNITGGTARTLTVNNTINITTGELYLFAGGKLNISTTGATTIGASGSILCDAAGTKTHTFSTSLGISNSGTIDFNSTNNLMTLTFTGSSNVSLTGSGSADLYTVTVNKGSSSTFGVTMDMTTVTTPATAWLTITNGTFNFANSGTYSVSTGTYTIGSTAKLKVTSGIVNILDRANNAGDLFLNGELEIAGGTARISNQETTTPGNFNNDIEYAATGSPTITVSGGNLIVNGQIRRSTSSTTGALIYNQTGGNVTVRGRAAITTRGVFEIDNNTGSSFIMSGSSNLTIERGVNATPYSDVFINPASNSVSSGSTITVGNSSAATSVRIDIKPTIGSFVVGSTGVATTATMYNNPLVLGGSLTINTTSNLTTQNLDVTIGQNLSCPGTTSYTGGTNTTTFTGSSNNTAQLSTGSTFNNLTINKGSSSTLTLSGTSPTLTNLNILAGTLDVASLDLAVNGDITNNSTQTSSGTGYLILSSSATAHSITNSATSGGGAFYKLRLAPASGGPSTSTITVSGNTTINGDLDFNNTTTTVYFFIGSNQLTFASTATVSNNLSTRFIKTNGVSSDAGVVKNWGTGTSSFTYAVGTMVNYTPVSFSNFNVTTAGTLTVVPVNSAHPTQSSTSSLVLLSYYWSVIKGTTLVPSLLANGSTGNVAFQAPTSLIAGSGGSLQGAYLDILSLTGSNGWNTITSNPTNPISTSGSNTLLTIYGAENSLSTYVPGTNKQFDYTFGDPSRLPSPIAFVYSRFADADMVSNPTTVGISGTGGSWGTANNWTLSSTGYGAALSSVPNNRPVYVLTGARINLDATGQTAALCQIDGTLVVTTTNQSIGIIQGTGTMRTSQTTLPAGNYTNFVASGGGTIEYSTTMNMANSRSTYNNLSITSGSGATITTPAFAFTLNGNLTIPAGTTLTNSNNNSNITIAGNWSNSGTYTAGTSETITFNGTSSSAITGTNTFNNFVINKTSSTSANNVLTIPGSTTTLGSLTLTGGYILTASTLALGSITISPSGGSSSSYIDGPITRTVSTSSTFIAPIGASSNGNFRYRPATVASTSGAATWSFQYHAGDPSNSGYNVLSVNSVSNNTNSALPIGKVSRFEFWDISPSPSTTANVTITYGTGSYTPPDILNLTANPTNSLASLRVAHWNSGTTKWEYPSGNGTFSQSGDKFAGSITITGMSSFSPTTVSTTDISSPLPVQLLYFTGKIVEGGIQLDWKTASELNNDHFTVEKSIGGEKFTAIAKIKGAGTTAQPNRYTYLDPQLHYGISYYRLKQTDFDGKSETFKVISVQYDGNTSIVLSVYPNPSNGADLNIELSGLKDAQVLPVIVTDQLGRVVLKGNFDVNTDGVTTKTLSTESLASGTYIVKVGTYLRRIVISK